MYGTIIAHKIMTYYEFIFNAEANVGIDRCVVTNANYDRVLSVMDKLLTNRYKDLCCCPRCLSDVAAIALNYLPPHYIVDQTHGRDEHGSPWVMVETAVTEAIDRVMENPNHARSASQEPVA